MSAESKFRDLDRGQLETLLGEYRASNERGQFTWKIEEIESELHRRETDTTIALDEERGLIIVRTTVDRIGRIFHADAL